MGAAVLGFAMLAVYLTLIVGQGGASLLVVVPWALLMAIAAVGAFSSARVEDRRVARKIMIGSAVLFVLLGIASALTIGFGFLLAAALSTVAASRLSDTDVAG